MKFDRMVPNQFFSERRNEVTSFEYHYQYNFYASEGGNEFFWEKHFWLAGSREIT